MAVGLAVLVVGVVVGGAPVVPQPTSHLDSRSTLAVLNVSGSFSWTGRIGIAIHWTASSAVSMLVFVCPSLNESARSYGAVCSGGTYRTENGTHGDATLSVPVHSTVLVGLVSAPPANFSATVTVASASPALGTLAVVGGAVLAVVGFRLPPSRPRSFRPRGRGPTGTAAPPNEAAPDQATDVANVGS